MDGDRSPLLLVDIDGVISLFGFEPANRPLGSFISVDGHLHYLSASAGAHLRRLGKRFELAWCSGWEERANEHLLGRLGLSPLPHLRFDGRPASTAHWKLSAIEAFAGPSRPVAWIDDAHDDATAAWAAQRPGPALLVRTEPAIGLTDEHVRALEAWAAGLRERDGEVSG